MPRDWSKHRTNWPGERMSPGTADPSTRPTTRNHEDADVVQRVLLQRLQGGKPMKTSSIIVIAGALALIASPADAGKKKRSKKKAAKTVEVERRLSDTLGLGVTLAARTGKTTPTPRLKEAKTGQSYDLGQLDRQSTTPTGDAELVVKAQPLSVAQV